MRENMREEFKSPDSVVQIDDSNEEVISNPDTDMEKVINERKKRKVSEIEGHLADIQNEMKILTQRSLLAETIREREEIKSQMLELSKKESEISFELTKAKDEIGQSIRPEEITKARLELEKAKMEEEKAVKNKLKKQKGPDEQKVKDFIDEIRNNGSLTLKEKEEMVRKRLEGMLDEKSMVKTELKADFETLRLFLVEIIGQKPKDIKADNKSKIDQPKEEKSPIEAAKTVEVEIKKTEGIIVEPKLKDVIIEANVDKEKIKKPEVAKIGREEQVKKAEKKMTPEEIKAKMEKIKEERERMERERKEQERKRLLLVEFAKNNEEEFKKIWFNLREKFNRLLNINTIIREEEEQINKILSKDKIDSGFDLRFFLRNESLMNDEKKNISYILDQGLSKENIEIIKDILQELVKKYENYKTEIARIDNDKTTGLMNSAFRELKDENIFDAVPYHNKEAEAISGEEFENLGKIIENIEKEIKAEKAKLFPVEMK